MGDVKIIAASDRAMKFALAKKFDGALGYTVDENGQPLDAVGYFVKSILPNLPFEDSSPVKDLDVSYLAHLKINAFASISNGIGYIFVSVGVKFRFLQIFNSLLSQPSCYLGVGDVSRIRPIFNKNLASMTASLDVNEMGEPIECYERFKKASKLSSIAELFLIFHELSHIMNGHLEFVSKNFSLPMIDELAENLGIEPLLMQTLEWDADCGAVSMILSFLFQAEPRFVGERKLASVTKDLDEDGINEILRDFSFSIYTLFKIFHQNHYDFFNFAAPDDFESLSKFKHPAPFVRVRSAIQLIFDALEETFGLNPETFFDCMAQSVLEAETSWAGVAGSDLRAPFSDDFTETFEKFIGIYNRNWSEIRHKLEKYNLGGNLAV